MKIKLDLISDRDKNVYSLNELDAVTPSSATELDCGEMLDYSVNRVEALQKILTKLRKGGRLIIRGNDLEVTSRLLVNGTIDVSRAAQALYDGRVNTSSTRTMVATLNQLGLKIKNVRIDNNIEYLIVAERV